MPAQEYRLTTGANVGIFTMSIHYKESKWPLIRRILWFGSAGVAAVGLSIFTYVSVFSSQAQKPDRTLTDLTIYLSRQGIEGEYEPRTATTGQAFEGLKEFGIMTFVEEQETITFALFRFDNTDSPADLSLGEFELDDMVITPSKCVSNGYFGLCEGVNDPLLLKNLRTAMDSIASALQIFSFNCKTYQVQDIADLEQGTLICSAKQQWLSRSWDEMVGEGVPEPVFESDRLGATITFEGTRKAAGLTCELAVGNRQAKESGCRFDPDAIPDKTLIKESILKAFKGF
jgi:hypothetical protein